jgi:hypothetical protein
MEIYISVRLTLRDLWMMLEALMCMTDDLFVVHWSTVIYNSTIVKQYHDANHRASHS